LTPQRSASARSQIGSASKMLVQFTSSWCAPSPATLAMMMRSGASCVTENGLIWSLEAANSMSDTVAMLVQRWPPSLSGSAHPHLTRELPASMHRIMRASP